MLLRLHHFIGQKNGAILDQKIVTRKGVLWVDYLKFFHKFVPDLYLILIQEVRQGRMQGSDHSMDPLDLRLYGEFAETSVKGVDDWTASVKRPRMRGHPLGAVIDHDRIRS